MVKNKSLILCEGGDDVGFLRRYIKFLEIAENKIDIEKMSNKSGFFDKAKYSMIGQKVETGQYEKILFVLDADFVENDVVYGGYPNTEYKIREMIQQLGFDELADIFISCDPTTKNGNLEHLLLSTVEDKKKSCLECFIDCVDGLDANSNKKIVTTSYEVIFKDTPYNFDHINFEILKNKIIELVDRVDE